MPADNSSETYAQKSPQGFDALSGKIVEDISSGGSGSAFKDEINNMNPQQLLEFNRSLSNAVFQHNLEHFRTPEQMLGYEAQLDAKTGQIRDIDILAKNNTNDAVRNLNRIDLVDSGKIGEDIDQKQELDFQTNPYEDLHRSREHVQRHSKDSDEAGKESQEALRERSIADMRDANRGAGENKLRQLEDNMNENLGAKPKENATRADDLNSPLDREYKYPPAVAEEIDNNYRHFRQADGMHEPWYERRNPEMQLYNEFKPR